MEKLQEKPEKLPYNTAHIKYRHYGKLVEKLIEEIRRQEDPEQKRALIVLTANHMKKSFLTWNKDSVGRTDLQRHQHIIRQHPDPSGRNDTFQPQRLTPEKKQTEFKQADEQQQKLPEKQ